MTFIYLNFTLFLFLLALAFGPNRFVRIYKSLTLLIVFYVWIISINLWLNCSWFLGEALFVDTWLSGFNIHCLFKLDTLSLFFVLLTTFIFPFCILSVWEAPLVRVLFFNLLCIELILILTFTVFDLFLFCILFEALLIPMFFIILWWGSRLRRIKALTYFFIYTLFGSIFLFLALFVFYFETGSTSFFSLHIWSVKLPYLWTGSFLVNFLWLLLFFVFAIKVPMFPFHIWLPEAHVEAPTVGSVILAALLLKLGGYGILRFLYVFPGQFFYWQPIPFFFILLSVWLGSISALRQLDLKRTIAYSSIAHMNFALAGFFSNSILGIVGGFSMLLSHGFVSAALFLLIGYIYDRYHTRTIPYYGGLVQVMPLWVFFFFIFIISNFSFPGTSNFIGEVLIFIGLGSTEVSFIWLLVLGLSTLLTVAYSLFLFNRVSFGSLKMQYIKAFSDLTRREVMLVLPLFCINIFFGLVPNFFLGPVYNSVLVYFSFPQNMFDTTFMFEKNKPNSRILVSPVDELAMQASLDIALFHQQFWDSKIADGFVRFTSSEKTRVRELLPVPLHEIADLEASVKMVPILERFFTAQGMLTMADRNDVFANFDIKFHDFYWADEVSDLVLQYYLAHKTSPEVTKFFFLAPLYWYEEQVKTFLNADLAQLGQLELFDNSVMLSLLHITMESTVLSRFFMTPRNKAYNDFDGYILEPHRFDQKLDIEQFIKLYYKPYLLHEKKILKELDSYFYAGI